jgi:hypothetical protein
MVTVEDVETPTVSLSLFCKTIRNKKRQHLTPTFVRESVMKMQLCWLLCEGILIASQRSEIVVVTASHLTHDTDTYQVM